MDVATHFRAIWQRRWMVLGGSLLVALAVFGLRAAASTVYTATAALYVVPPGGDVPDVRGEVRRLTASYADLVDDPQVVEDAARAAGAPPELVDRRTEIVRADDGQVVLAARAGTATEAVTLANAAAASLSAAADRQQAAALERELAPLDAELAELDAQIAGAGSESGALENRRAAVFSSRVERLSEPRARLDLVGVSRADDIEVSPRPLRDALLAFLLALIAQAELAAILAARFAGLEGRDPLRVLRQWTQLPVFRAGDSRRGADQSPAALLHVRAAVREQGAAVPDDPPAVALAALSGPDGTASAVDVLTSAARGAFDAVTLVDLREDPLPVDDVAVVRPGPGEVEAVVRTAVARTPAGGCVLLIADRWEDPQFLLLARALSATTLVVVESETVRRPVLRQTIDTLEDARADVRGVLVVEEAESGRDRWGRRVQHDQDDQRTDAVGATTSR